MNTTEAPITPSMRKASQSSSTTGAKNDSKPKILKVVSIKKDISLKSKSPPPPPPPIPPIRESIIRIPILDNNMSMLDNVISKLPPKVPLPPPVENEITVKMPFRKSIINAAAAKNADTLNTMM